MNKTQTIYECAKLSLGEHITLNDNVPVEVGCAEAVSFVLRSAGFPIPKGGIPGVNALIEWLLTNGFEEITQPLTGAVITAHSPDKDVTGFAHTGICGRNWIMSNSSGTGIFQANYQYPNWNQYFGANGSVTRYFIPIQQ